jgi:hypothetical protein
VLPERESLPGLVRLTAMLGLEAAMKKLRITVTMEGPTPEATTPEGTALLMALGRLVQDVTELVMMEEGKRYVAREFFDFDAQLVTVRASWVKA